MKPEEFKKLGLKSGDRVKVILENNNIRRGMYISYSAGQVIWLPEAEERPWKTCIERPWETCIEAIQNIGKLKVTKKKEKKEKEQGIDYPINYDAAIGAPYLDKFLFFKPIKSLNNLEVGDEEEKICRSQMRGRCKDCNGLLRINEKDDWVHVKPAKPSVIDEMIEYFENKLSWEASCIPQFEYVENKKTYNKFINHLKELKNG